MPPTHSSTLHSILKVTLQAKIKKRTWIFVLLAVTNAKCEVSHNIDHPIITYFSTKMRTYFLCISRFIALLSQCEQAKAFKSHRFLHSDAYKVRTDIPDQIW